MLNGGGVNRMVDGGRDTFKQEFITDFHKTKILKEKCNQNFEKHIERQGDFYGF